jgi:hypothetical protein
VEGAVTGGIRNVMLSFREEELREEGEEGPREL